LFSGINKDIWVVGSSMIQRAGEHSKIRPTGTFVGLQQRPFAIIVFSSMPFKNDCVAAPMRNEWVLNSSGL
jgi:hypothetical protein